MKIERHSKAAAVLVGGLGLALATGGTAYAVWTTSGTGTGTAVAGSSSALTVTGTANVSGLYPTAAGVAGGSVSVQNPNSFNVAITGVTFAPTQTTKGGCTASTVSFAVGAAAPTQVGAGQTVSIPLTASMTNAAEDACQGASFTTTVTVTGESAA